MNAKLVNACVKCEVRGLEKALHFQTVDLGDGISWERVNAEAKTKLNERFGATWKYARVYFTLKDAGREVIA